MNEVQDSVCPLCNSTAKVQHHPLKHSNHFVCQSCGDLVIKQRAVSWLLNAPSQAKFDFAKIAKQCTEGKVLFISLSTVAAQDAPKVTAECLPLAEALSR